MNVAESSRVGAPLEKFARKKKLLLKANQRRKKIRSKKVRTEPGEGVCDPMGSRGIS